MHSITSGKHLADAWPMKERLCSMQAWHQCCHILILTCELAWPKTCMPSNASKIAPAAKDKKAKHCTQPEAAALRQKNEPSTW
jgi:hypothetical protein